MNYQMTYIQKIQNLFSKSFTGKHIEPSMTAVSVELVKSVVHAFADDFGPRKEYIRVDISERLQNAMLAEMVKIPTYYSNDALFDSMFEVLEYDKMPVKYPSGLYKLREEALGDMVSAIMTELGKTVKVLSAQEKAMVKENLVFLLSNLVSSKYIHPDKAIPKAERAFEKSATDSKLLFDLISAATLSIVNASITVAYQSSPIALKVEDEIGSLEDALMSSNDCLDEVNREEIIQEHIDYDELVGNIKDKVLSVAMEKKLGLDGNVGFDVDRRLLVFSLISLKGKTSSVSIGLSDLSKKGLSDIGEAAIDKIIDFKSDRSEDDEYDNDEEFDEIE